MNLTNKKSKYVNEILSILNKSCYITLEKAEKIAKDYEVVDDFKNILKELIYEGSIDKKIIISCPYCFNDLGSRINFEFGSNYTCVHCGQNFIATKNLRNIFFFKN